MRPDTTAAIISQPLLAAERGNVRTCAQRHYRGTGRTGALCGALPHHRSCWGVTICGRASIRIGVFVNVKPDCTSGPLPTIRLAGPPEHGKVAVKRVKVQATNYRECLALDVPGYIAFYQSRPDFSGTDLVTLEIKRPDGRVEIQKITVTVAEATPRSEFAGFAGAGMRQQGANQPAPCSGRTAACGTSGIAP